MSDDERGPNDGFVVLPDTDIGGAVYEGAPCIVCRKAVAQGEGAQAMPPFPALHSRCLKVAMAKLERGGPGAMRLRVAKNVACALSCAKAGCGHRWSSIMRATAIVARAVRRGSGRVPLHHLDYWSDADRAQAGLGPGKDGHL